MNYDYIIVGSGPTGLTLGYYLGKIGKRVIIIERDNSIGGCHKVRRVDGYFTEHGPRVVLDNYHNFIKLLHDMNIDFHDIYTKYDSPIGYFYKLLRTLKITELMVLGYYFIKFLINPEIYMDMTVAELLINNNFSDNAKDLIDEICITTDGARIDRYTVWELFQLLNQNIFYSTYQPIRPNDKLLFKLWKDKLNADILLNTTVTGLGRGYVKLDNSKIIHGDKIILAVPPESLLQILPNRSDKLNNWIHKTKYETYLPITFHWLIDIHSKLDNQNENSHSEWGIIMIIQSKYTQFEKSKTLISVSLTKLDTPSTVTGKTVNQSPPDEIKIESWRQLKTKFKNNIPDPDKIIISPGVYHDRNRWYSRDHAFVLTKYRFLDRELGENIYSIGTHNGNSDYGFTSIESSVINSLDYLNKEEHMDIKIVSESFTLKNVLMYLVVIIILFLFLRYI